MRDNLFNQEPLGLSKSPEDLKVPKVDMVNGDNENENKNRFFTIDVKFFNLFYDNKSNNMKADIKYTKKNIYFRDITMFINKIKDITRVKKVELLRNNL